MAAWTDPDTAAVWAARGGYGAQRMVDLLDFDLLRAAGPKHLVGFSDITALHSRLGRELGQVTVHGPVAGSVEQLSDETTGRSLRQLIMERPEPGSELASGCGVVPGTAYGRLWGGNLSLLASDVGVEPLPADPLIMVIEDVGEDGYRLDRMLTQLRRAGWLDQVAGVLVGDLGGDRLTCPGAALPGRPRRPDDHRRARRPRRAQPRPAAGSVRRARREPRNAAARVDAS